LDKEGNIDRVPIKKDLTSETKWVLFDSCIRKPSGFANNGNTKIVMYFDSITNPYSVRDTSKFIVEVYKTFDKDTGTLS
jgi:hypothetical protein